VKLIFFKIIFSAIILTGSLFFYGCKKQMPIGASNNQYQDSLFFELEYNSLNFDTDTVDFGMNGDLHQL
jgi:hypothetical protein